MSIHIIESASARLEYATSPAISLDTLVSDIKNETRVGNANIEIEDAIISPGMPRSKYLYVRISAPLMSRGLANITKLLELAPGNSWLGVYPKTEDLRITFSLKGTLSDEEYYSVYEGRWE